MKFWIHADPNVQAAASRGLARALSGDWTTGTPAERERDFRGFVIYHAWVANELGGTVTLGGSGASATARVEPQTPADPERARAQRDVLGAALLLARGAGMPEHWFLPEIVKTATPPETGILPAVAAIAIALADVAEYAALAWLGVNAAQVVDNYLARNAKARDFAVADAQALKVLELHAETEQRAGHPLPLGAAEDAVLSMLEKRSAEIAKQQTSPLGIPNFLGGEDASIKTGLVAGGLVLIAGAVAAKYFHRAA